MNKTMVDPRLPLQGLELISSDGAPLDSEWHGLAMNLLIECVNYLWRDRDDFFAGGNMFLYYNRERARHRDFRGPDFFVVKGIARKPLREYWAVWQEDGRFPNVIIELLSPSTAQEDRTTKKDIYEQIFQTPEYFIYDPHARTLEGWRLTPAGYETLNPNLEDRLWSEELGVWMGKWVGYYLGKPGCYLRFFDEQGRLIPIGPEASKEEAERQRQRAEQERQRAEQERQRAEQERQRAEQENQHADSERQRAEAAEAEVARLRALLSQTPPAKTD